MPEAVPPGSPFKSRPSLALGQKGNDSQPATILLLDDNEDDVVLLRTAFARSGIQHRLNVVHQVEDALSYLRGDGRFADRQAHPLPSLMLLDLKVAGGSGLEVLKWLQGQPDFARLVTVVVTGSFRPSDMEHAYQLGANAFVVKSAGFEELISLLKSFQLGG